MKTAHSESLELQLRFCRAVAGLDLPGQILRADPEERDFLADEGENADGNSRT